MIGNSDSTEEFSKLRRTATAGLLHTAAAAGSFTKRQVARRKMGVF